MQDEELYMVQFTKDSDFYAFDEYGKHKPIEMEMVNRRGQVAILIVNSFDNPD